VADVAHFQVLDLETTSRFTQEARIVQWALVGFSRRSDGSWGCDPLHRHVALVDPGVAIPTEATAIHGIRDADVVAAPTTKQSLPWLLRYMQGAWLCGYNILEYDLPVLREECRRHGLTGLFRDAMTTLRTVVDVLPWASRTTSAPTFRKGARTLGTMAQRHGVATGRCHDAGDDAEATGRLMLSLVASGHMSCVDDLAEASAGTWEHLRC
jgi:DNA polymerase III subunit epsilon